MELIGIVEEASSSKKRDEIGKQYNPSYMIVEDYLSSIRCPCACNPGPPGPYCGPGPCGPPKCSRKVVYNK